MFEYPADELVEVCCLSISYFSYEPPRGIDGRSFAEALSASVTDD
jgi:hypothetical protein